MSHSLNEISRVIPSGTATTNIELILDTLEELMEGVRDGYYVYFDAEKTMGYRFNYTEGSNSCPVTVIAGTVTIQSITNFSLTSGCTIYAHKSTNETVTYISISSSNKLTTFYVIGHNGSKNLYGFNDVSDIRGVGENMSGYKVFAPFKNQQDLGVIAITKMPDALNLNSYDEFYVVVGSSNFSVNNYLVKFGDTVYRFATFDRSSSASFRPSFAFPVSDPT